MFPSDLQVTKEHSYTGHRGAIYALAIEPNQTGFLTGAGDGLIAAWKFNDPGHAVAVAKVPGNIFSLAQSQDNQYLAAGDMNGGLYIIDREQKNVISNLSRNGTSVFDLKFDPSDGNLIAACGDGYVRLWDRTFAFGREVQLSGKSLRNISLSPVSELMAFASSDHRIIITDRAFREIYALEGHSNSVFCTAFHPSGEYLISGSRDAQLIVWDVRNEFRMLKQIQAHLFTINDVKYSPDGKLFATAGRDKHVKLWDAESLNLLKVLDHEKYGGHINSVNKLVWTQDGSGLISCGDDRSVIYWKII